MGKLNINFDTTKIFVFFIFAFVAIYLIGAFVQADGIPTNVDATILNSFKIIVIGVASLLGFGIVTKFRAGDFTSKDFITFALLAVGVWLLWDNVLVNFLNAPNLSEISFAVAKKVGLFP